MYSYNCDHACTTSLLKDAMPMWSTCTQKHHFMQCINVARSQNVMTDDGIELVAVPLLGSTAAIPSTRATRTSSKVALPKACRRIRILSPSCKCGHVFACLICRSYSVAAGIAPACISCNLLLLNHMIGTPGKLVYQGVGAVGGGGRG